MTEIGYLINEELTMACAMPPASDAGDGQRFYVMFALFAGILLFAPGCLGTEMSRNAIQGAVNEVRGGLDGVTAEKNNDDPFGHESLKADLP
jgi:hypothetical protein